MRFALGMITALSLALCGCSKFLSQGKYLAFSDAMITDIQISELDRYLRSNDRNVLVQFRANSHCWQCEAMKPNLARLAEIYRDSTKVVRINVSGKTELVADDGAIKFPTYALFERGRREPVFVQSHPVSSDMLEAELLASLALSDE